MEKDSVDMNTNTLTVASGHRLLVTMEAGHELIVTVVVRKELVLVGHGGMEGMLVAIEVENKD